jgi:hypothetical protein
VSALSPSECRERTQESVQHLRLLEKTSDDGEAEGDRGDTPPPGARAEPAILALQASHRHANFGIRLETTPE